MPEDTSSQPIPPLESIISLFQEAGSETHIQDTLERFESSSIILQKKLLELYGLTKITLASYEGDVLRIRSSYDHQDNENLDIDNLLAQSGILRQAMESKERIKPVEGDYGDTNAIALPLFEDTQPLGVLLFESDKEIKLEQYQELVDLLTPIFTLTTQSITERQSASSSIHDLNNWFLVAQTDLSENLDFQAAWDAIKDCNSNYRDLPYSHDNLSTYLSDNRTHFRQTYSSAAQLALDHIEQISESSESLEKIKDLLFHLKNHEIGFYPQKNNLNDIVTNFLENNQELSNLGDVNIEFEQGNVTTSYFHRESIERSLLNFVKNAAEANSKNIVIRTYRADSGENILDVQDDGDPFDEEILKRYGEDFNSSKNFGTGIGLSSSRRFIEMHGGTLSKPKQDMKTKIIRASFPEINESYNLAVSALQFRYFMHQGASSNAYKTMLASQVDDTDLVSGAKAAYFTLAQRTKYLEAMRHRGNKDESQPLLEEMDQFAQEWDSMKPNLEKLLAQDPETVVSAEKHKFTIKSFMTLFPVYINMQTATIYKELEMYDESLRINLDSLSILEETEKTEDMNSPKGHLLLREKAKVLNNIGTVYRHQKEFTKAMECYEKSQAIVTEDLSEENNEFKQVFISTLNNIGYWYYEQIDTKTEYESQAKFHFESAFNIAQEISEATEHPIKSLAISNSHLAEWYLKKEDKDNAFKHINNSIDIAREEGYLDTLRESLEILATIEKKYLKKVS
tara:strand:- start:2781 stop:4997 length:2217 start_codon:yes stop_codon:yes gene_type:complete